MKKIILTSIGLLLGSQLYAQTLPLSSNIITNPTNLTAGTQTYSYPSSAGTQSIISPAAGVYIQPPQWVQGLNNQNSTPSVAAPATTAKDPEAALKDARSVKSSMDDTDAQKQADQKKTADANDANKTIQAALPNPASATAVTQAPVVQTKRVGQTLEQTPNITTNNIALWNNTTINEFEEQGQKNLEKAYQQSLMNR